MSDTRDDEPAIVADTRNSLTTAEDDGEVGGSIANFHLDGGDSRPRLDAHASNLTTHRHSLAHRHVGERDEVQIAKLGAQALGRELFASLGAAGEEILEPHCGFQRTLNGVSTRKLIVASLICGLLILVAGTVKLLQTANDDAATTNILRVGAEATVGEILVVVNDVNVTSERTLVNVTVKSSNAISPSNGWSMLANGEITEPLGSRDCPANTVDATCTLEFVVAVGTPTIVFAHDGEKRQWLGS